MEEERKERDYLERLRNLRDNYSDEIPEEILSGLSKRKKYKVRRQWFHAVVGSLWNALRTGQISDPEVQTEAKEFIKHHTSEEFHKQPLTTAEDIERANRVIGVVLGERT